MNNKSKALVTQTTHRPPKMTPSLVQSNDHPQDQTKMCTYLEQEKGVPLGREIGFALCLVGPVHHQGTKATETCCYLLWKMGSSLVSLDKFVTAITITTNTINCSYTLTVITTAFPDVFIIIIMITVMPIITIRIIQQCLLS